MSLKNIKPPISVYKVKCRDKHMQQYFDDRAKARRYLKMISVGRGKDYCQIIHTTMLMPKTPVQFIAFMNKTRAGLM